MTIQCARYKIVKARTLVLALLLWSCKVKDSIAIPEASSDLKNGEANQDPSEVEVSIENQPAQATPDSSGPASGPVADGQPVVVSNSNVDPIDPIPTSPVPIIPIETRTVADGSYLIKAFASGRCLDIPESNTNVGIQVQIFACNTNSAQTWKITHVGDNFYSITNPNGRSLEVRNGLLADRSPLQTGNFSSLDTQIFRFEKQDDSFRILVKNSEFAVDIANFGITDRSKIEMYLKDAVDSQKWNLILLQ